MPSKSYSISRYKRIPLLILSGTLSLLTISCSGTFTSGGPSNSPEFASGLTPTVSAPGTAIETFSDETLNPFIDPNTGTTVIPGTPPIENPNPVVTTTPTENTVPTDTPVVTTTPGEGNTPTAASPVAAPTQCNTQADIDQYLLARSQESSGEFAAPCSGNFFYLSQLIDGSFGCVAAMPYNIAGNDSSSAFLTGNGISLDLGTPSRFIGLRAGNKYISGRAVRKSSTTGRCTMTTVTAIVVDGESQADLDKQVNEFTALSLVERLRLAFSEL